MPDINYGAAFPPEGQASVKSNSRELLSRLREASHQKRVILSKLSHRYGMYSKILYLGSAFIALLSGGSTAAQALKLLEYQWFGGNASEIAATLAFISGITSLLTTCFFPFENTQRLYKGAGDFLALRENIDLELNRPAANDKQLFFSYEKLDHRYVALSHDFEPYFAAHHAKSKMVASPTVLTVPSL